MYSPCLSLSRQTTTGSGTVASMTDSGGGWPQIRDLHVLPCPVLQVVLVLTESQRPGAEEQSLSKDWANDKVLLNLNTKRREAQEEEIPKVFDYTSDLDYGELFQTLDQYDILEP